MPEWGTKPANHYLPRRKTEWQKTAEQAIGNFGAGDE